MKNNRKRHINIPVFVVHMGCPNQCVFCDQRLISGVSCFQEDSVRSQIETVLATASADAEKEIAFFGGSFTGIDRAQMIRLLDLAQSYVDSGAVSGIRMSTRSDYITPEILTILSRYTVSMVELGIQSLSDRVLFLCRRGHTAADSENACRMLRDAGIAFGAQMMVGLPGSDVETERECARLCCAWGAAAYRVYPTMVLRHTELEEMTARGEYVPLSDEDAAVRMAAVMEEFERGGAMCLRAGLCETQDLHSPDSYSAGPSHPAIGEWARGEIFYRRMTDLLERAGNLRRQSVTFFVPVGCASAAAGMNRRNTWRIREKYGIKLVKIIENPQQIGYNIKMGISENCPSEKKRRNRHCD